MTWPYWPYIEASEWPFLLVGAGAFLLGLLMGLWIRHERRRMGGVLREAADMLREDYDRRHGTMRR